MNSGDVVEIIATSKHKDGKNGTATVIRATRGLVLVDLNGKQYWFNKTRVKGYEG